jgi:hypothetical protein
MTIQLLRKAICYGTTATILALLLGLGSMTSSAADNNKKPAPPPKPAPAARPGPAFRPSGGSGGGASHGPTTGGFASHGPTTGGFASHGPTTGGFASHGPTNSGANTMTTGGGGTTMHGPTTGGGMHNTGASEEPTHLPEERPVIAPASQGVEIRAAVLVATRRRSEAVQRRGEATSTSPGAAARCACAPTAG